MMNRGRWTRKSSWSRRWRAIRAMARVAIGMSIATAVYAGGDMEQSLDELLPVYEQELYRVGFRDFELAIDERSNEYLRRGLTRVLLERFRAIERHQLTELEQWALRASLMRQERAKVGAELDSAIDQLDALRYSMSDSESIQDNRENLQEDIDKKRASLQLLNDAPLISVEIVDELPVEFWIPEDEISSLLTVEPLNRFAERNDLDVVVSGLVTEENDFIFIDIVVYNAILDKERRLDTAASPVDNVEIAVDAIIQELSTIILGREWATLDITNVPEDAQVYLNDNFLHNGDARVEYVPTGKHTIRFSRPAFSQNRDIVIDLAPYELYHLDGSFPLPAGEYTRIETNPYSTNVYIDSVWQGVTPINFQLPTAESYDILLSLRQVDYYDGTLVISSDSPSLIYKTLSPIDFDAEEYVASGRDQFYYSLGAFAVSAVAPLLISGFVADNNTIRSSSGFNELDTPQQNQLINEGNALSIAFGSSIFLTGVLFLNTIIDLVGYISAGERYHGR